MSQVNELPCGEPVVDEPLNHETAVPLPTWSRLVMLLVVIVPFLGLVAAIVLLWGWALTWVEISVFAGMYVVSALGVTVGFHRLFTHRSFETNRVVQAILAVFGSMAVQGPLLKWVAAHRRHHQHSDKPGDPHSPHLYGSGIMAIVRGLYHAHLGWLFKPDTANLRQYVRDLRNRPLLHWVSILFPLWVVLGLLLPAVLCGILTLTWKGALLGLIWGGLVRIFLSHHVTWSINSVCHFWGRQPYPADDHSRNNFLFGVIAMGEGWHNNHHAFPTSARHGLRWWQVDFSYWVIRALALVGLAWNVKLPAKAALAAS